MMIPSPVTRHPSPAVPNAARFVSVVAAVLFWASTCVAQQVTSTGLIARADEYDGKTVIFQGEVIGDIMVRGEYAWVNVSDGAAAIGIWMRAPDARTIERGGAYLVRGDTIKVTGTFHRSCLQHGGDLDIHAETVSIITSGSRFSAEPLAPKAKIAGGLALILGVIWILRLLRKR